MAREAALGQSMRVVAISAETEPGIMSGGAPMQIVQNADGRLEVFARGVDRALIHIWQTAPNNGWSDWDSLGIPHPEYRAPDGFAIGDLDSAPAVGRNADGRLEVFAVGSANTFQADLVHIWQVAPNSPWSGWASLGGRWKLTAPAVGRNADGRLEVFARAEDDSLWHIWQTAPSSGWSNWMPLGNGIVGAPVVISNADGRMEVFVRGRDALIWHIWQTSPNGGWSGWAPLGRLAGQGIPSVGLNADGRLEVFAATGAVLYGRLGHVWQTANGGWSDWAEDLLILAQYESPSVAANADGRLEVFGGGVGSQVTHQWQSGFSPIGNGWSEEGLLGGEITGTPVVVGNADGRLEVFVRGLDHELYHKWQIAPDSDWSDWDQLGDWHISDVGRSVIEESGVLWGHN